MVHKNRISGFYAPFCFLPPAKYYRPLRSCYLLTDRCTHPLPEKALDIIGVFGLFYCFRCHNRNFFKNLSVHGIGHAANHITFFDRSRQRLVIQYFPFNIICRFSLAECIPEVLFYPWNYIFPDSTPNRRVLKGISPKIL